MFDKFGEFDSCEEINRAAKAQLEEGDLEAIRTIAEENGLDGDCNGGNGIYDHPSEENVGEKRKRCIRRKRAVKSDRRDKDSDRKGKTSGSER